MLFAKPFSNLFFLAPMFFVLAREPRVNIINSCYACVYNFSLVKAYIVEALLYF